MTDDIVTRLRERADRTWTGSDVPSSLMLKAADEIERLRAYMDVLVDHNVELMARVAILQAAIDSAVREIDTDHKPMWASDEAKESGKKPFWCSHCCPQENGWPCTHRKVLDELKAVQSNDQNAT